jgi:RHS repeat-associated protein
MDSSGSVLVKESFTAFGARRGSNWQGIPTTADYTVFRDVTRRGFTGHEMLDAVGLVNMNGRVYDPYLARVLSPDPLIPSMALSQAVNPFSYVMNSPLSWTDPSGYSFLGKGLHWVGHKVGSFGRSLLNTALHDLNLIVGGALMLAGALTVNPALSAAGFALVSSPVHVTLQNGKFGVAVRIGFAVIAPPSANSARGPPNWGNGSPEDLSGIPVMSENGIVDPNKPSAGEGLRAFVVGGYAAFSDDLASLLTFGYAPRGEQTGGYGDTFLGAQYEDGGRLGHAIFDAAAIASAFQGLYASATRGFNYLTARVALRDAPRGAAQLGRAGEAAAGIVKNTERIASATGTAAYRVPDALNHAARTIGEVKNVGSLSYTNQLRDFASYASRKGYTFELWVRPTTQLSGPLQQAISDGEISLRFLP